MLFFLVRFCFHPAWTFCSITSFVFHGREKSYRFRLVDFNFLENHPFKIRRTIKIITAQISLIQLHKEGQSKALSHSESWIEHGLRHKQNLWHWACLSTTLNQSGPFQQRCCFLTCASVCEYLWVCGQKWVRRRYNPQNPHSRPSWSHLCSLNAQLPGLVTRKEEDTPQAQRLLSSHSSGAVLWGYCYISKAGGQILVPVGCFCMNIKRNGTWQDSWIVNLCLCDVLVPCTPVGWLCQ